MSRERKRERKEIAEKGVPIAEPGTEVIWNDPKLKTSFISTPFISRLKGRATLEQTLAYNLYFDDLTKKWKPLSDLTISTVKNLGRFYTADPDVPTVLSDLPLRITDKHELRVQDVDLAGKFTDVYTKLNELKAFNEGVHCSGEQKGIDATDCDFPSGNIPWTSVDFYLDLVLGDITVSIKVLIGLQSYVEVYNEVFSVVAFYKRRVILFSAKACYLSLSGSVFNSGAYYRVHGSHLPFEVAVLE